MAIQDLTASLDLKQNLNIYATCKQLDNLNLILNIYDNSIQADLSNYNVRLVAMKADKIPLIQEHVGITINNNIVTIATDEQLTTTSGRTLIELQFINNSTGQRKATFNLALMINPSTLEVDSTISTATYTLMQQFVNELDRATDYFNNIETFLNEHPDIPALDTRVTAIEGEIETARETYNNLDERLDIYDLSTNKINNLNIVNVKDYGVKGDGSSNDSTNLQSLIESFSGGILYFPKGHYLINNINIDKDDIQIIGEGLATKFSPFSSCSYLFNVTGSNTVIKNVSLENANSFASVGISCNKLANNLFIYIIKNYFTNFNVGIAWHSGDRAYIKSNTMISNGTGIFFYEDGRGATILENFILGGNGINFSRTTQQAEGVIILYNQIFPASQGTYAITINQGLHIDISHNCIDQVITGNGINLNSQYCREIKITNNWIGANVDSTTANYGIYADHGTGIYIQTNTIIGWSQTGIYLNGGTSNIIDKVVIENNNFDQDDPNLRDIQLNYATNVLIHGCMFSGTANIVEGNGCDGVIERCHFTVIPAMNNMKYGKQLSGMIMKNKGTGTITSGSRTATVNHGLSFAPSASDITIMLQAFSSSSTGQINIDTITTTSFRVVLEFAPTANIAFSWKVDISQ